MKRNLIKIGIIVSFLCICLSVNATFFRHLTTTNGLSHQEVMSISQDMLGRIWIGTRNGVNIFNGRRIESYKMFLQKDSTFFYANNVKAIMADSKGDMYLRSSLKCIKYYIKQNRFEVLPIERVSCLYSCQGRIYVCVDGSIYRMDTDTNEIRLFKSFSKGNITNMVIDKKGNVWFSTAKALYFCNDEEVVKKCEVNDIHTLYLSSDGSVWVSSPVKGIMRWTDQMQVQTYSVDNYRTKGLFVNNFRGIVEDKDGCVWFGSSKGLYKFDTKNDRFEVYSSNKLYGELSKASIHTLFLDKDNNIWVSRYLGGVYSFSTSHNSFNFYDDNSSDHGLSYNIVGDMVEDRNGQIWIGTEGGGLNCFDPQTCKFRHFKSNRIDPINNYRQFLPQNNIKSLAYDSLKNVLYVGTNSKGLYSYDINKNHFQNISLTTDRKTLSVNSLSLSGNYLAISTNDKINIYDIKTGKDSVFFSVRSNFYRYVSEVDAGKFLFVNNGMNEIDVNDKQMHLKKVVVPHILNSFTKTNRNYVFMTSHGGGIYRWNLTDNTILRLNDKMGGIAKFCYKIAETKSGNLVVTCDEGLCIIDQDGRLLRLLKLTNSVPLGSFTRDCGLFVASDGIIYVGSTDGLLTFEEKDILSASQMECLYFSDLYIQNKRILPDSNTGIIDKAMPFMESITIPSWHSKIDIHFATKNDIIDVTTRRYKYRLLNLEEDWNYISSNVITYTSLPSGHYTLELMACDVISNNTEMKRLDILVLSAWYSTWWAYLIWITLVLSVFYIIYRVLSARRAAKELLMREHMENEKIKAVNEAKFQFFTNVSHEFKTPLTLIIGQIEQLINGYKLPPILYNKLMKIMRYSHQMGSLVTELMEYRKYNKEQFVLNVSKCEANAFFNNICLDFKGMAVKNNLSFYYEPSEEEVDIYIDKNQMSKVVNNLLSNAFKFTPEGGKIVFKVWKGDDMLFFSVSDTGRGIHDVDKIFQRFYQDEASDIPNTSLPGTGVGLSLVKEIVEQHKGRIEVQSTPGQGSIFTVSLRLGSDHFNDIMIFRSEGETEDLFNDTEIELTMQDNLDEDNEYWGKGVDKPSMLIVEDNVESQEILTSLFSPFYKVQTAADGEIGLSKARQTNPDIILSDWIMPKMSGTEMCSRIKNDIELCHIPVILLTALNLPEQQMEGFLCGADDYVSKPFNSKILLARCNNIIRSRKLMYQKLAKQVQNDLSLCATNGMDKEFLDKVTRYIDENLSSESFTIDMLSAHVNMSRSLFYNKFKNLTGMTPNDYINNYRLKKAAMWLTQHKEKSINEISEELGFNTHNYFSTKFKECYGVTPLQYRKKNLDDKD